MCTVVPLAVGDERGDDGGRRVALTARVAALGLEHHLALASSASSILATPLYCAVIGPTLIFTMPRYSSPSISWSCAPGMHGAMRSTSSSTFHASSIGHLDPELVFDLHWSSCVQLFEILEGVDVGGAAGAVAGDLDDVVSLHELRAPMSPSNCDRFGQRLRASNTGLPRRPS